MTPPSPCPHKTRVATTDGLKPFCNECESEKDVAINKANEKNWYNSLDWYYETKFGHIVPDLPRIVAKAERRGRVAAWEEVREIIYKQRLAVGKTLSEQHELSLNKQFCRMLCDNLEDLERIFDTKLTELKKV